MIRLGIDAMGGDFAPEAVVLGAIEAVRSGLSSRIVLFGDKEAIEKIASENGCPADAFDIVPSTEVITMSDHPAQAFRNKPQSSIAIGFGYLRAGKIDCLASAGSTGAMLVGSMYTVGSVEGIIRPVISSHIPTADGKTALILDVGLNVDCRPDVLFQYGLMGDIYAKNVLGIQNPRVGLLNIGEEKEKGNLVSKAAYELMEDNGKYNFVGNVEGKHIFTGQIADVIVCDGFVGNVVLKQAESFYVLMRKMGYESNRFLDGLNYEFVGGTPVLGVNANVIIGHGCSSPKAIKSMIEQSERTVKAGLVEKFRQALH